MENARLGEYIVHAACADLPLSYNNHDICRNMFNVRLKLENVNILKLDHVLM